MTESAHRFRSMAALFAGVGFSATGFIALVTVTPLVAEDLLGTARWSGMPSALAIVGTAVGTSWLASVMARHGRRRGLLLGYLTACAAAAVAAVAAGASMFVLLAASIFVLGTGYGASRLSRYAAADLYEPSQRARAIGWVVWAGTIGSVLGPVLLEPARRFAESVALPDITGPYLLASVAMGAAALVLFVALPSDSQASAKTAGAQKLALSHLKNPRSQIALGTLVMGQVVMILIMTMTPIHIRMEGRGLSSIGFVIASHTLGMYALSPLSGFLSDRIGRVPVILAACSLILSSTFVSAGANESNPLLALGLFLLGWGWNLSFVSGSALLTESVPHEERMRLQGFADSVVWASAAAAGLSSGLLLDSTGYDGLCRLGAVFSVLPVALILFRGRR